MQTSYSSFTIDKSSDPFGDTLTAYGLATIVRDLLEWQLGDDSAEITIRDAGTGYMITVDPPLLQETVERYSSSLMPARPIETLKNAEALPEGIGTVNYEAQKQQTNAYFAARKAGQDATLPDPDWHIYRAINPAALPGYNAAILNWYTVRNDARALLMLLNLYSTAPNDYEGVSAAWKKLDKEYGWGISSEVTGQQLYNPAQGKGQNKPKADGLSIGNLKGFWMVEWLKAVGFYEAAFTRLVRGSKDRKSFVVAPQTITFVQNSAIMERFHNAMLYAETPARFDILAAVRYLRVMMEYFFPAEDDDNIFADFLDVWQPQQTVAGFYTAYYKDLGNAVATMNLSFIALPGWVNVRSADDVLLYIEDKVGLLSELERLTQQFEESHSDAVTLLQHLRDFVSGDDLSAFFRFTNAFPAYMTGRIERNQYVYPLTTRFIERLMMSTDRKLGDILQDEGFQAVAYAIRQSTRTAQIRRKNGDRKYEARYGLGQELARKSRYRAEFVTALADFLHKYNAESVRVMETRPGPYRKSVSTDHIERVVALIDEYGAPTVANLLIAYGYARVPRDEEDQPGYESEQVIEDTQEDE